jgi:hypothetical protein
MTEFLSKTAVFVTDWFTLVEKRFADSPSSAPYFALETSDYVSVVPLTQNDELVLVRQYRPARGGANLRASKWSRRPRRDPDWRSSS